MIKQKRFKVREKEGFTLIEILLVLLMLGIIVTTGIFMYRQSIEKAKSTEAVIAAGDIRTAEVARKIETGNYVAAENTEKVNELLGVGVLSKDFEYRVIGVTDDNFLILAHKVNEDIKAGKFSPESIVVAMDKDGLVNYYPGSGGEIGGSGTTGGAGGSSGVTGGGGGGGTGSGGSAGGGGSTGGGGTGSSSGTGGDKGGTGGGSGTGGDKGGTGGDEGTGGDKGGTGGGDDTGGGGKVAEVELADALVLLQNSTYGGDYYNLIIEENITLLYADLGENVLGQWVPLWWLDFFPEDKLAPNTIYISSTLRTTWSEEAIATILVHEALHADYNYNTEEWVAATIARYGVDRSELAWYLDPVTNEMVLGDSIDQEYNCFVQEAMFWKEKRGTESNDELDYILSLYEQGGSELYDAVASAYVSYPLYDKELK